MPVPNTVTRDEMLTAVKPLLDLLGIDDINRVMVPLVISADRVSVVLANDADDLGAADGGNEWATNAVASDVDIIDGAVSEEAGR